MKVRISNFQKNHNKYPNKYFFTGNYDDLTVSDLYKKVNDQQKLDNEEVEIMKKSDFLMDLLQVSLK